MAHKPKTKSVLDYSLLTDVRGFKWDGKNAWEIIVGVDQEADPANPPTITLPYEDPPHGPLIDVFQALGGHALSIMGLAQSGGRLEVRELSFSNVDGEDYDFQIKAVQYPPGGPGTMAFNTVVRSIRSGPKLATNSTVFEAIETLCTLAMNYVRGDRPQLSFDFNDNEEAKKTKAPELQEA